MGVEGELENWRSFAIPHCKIEFESYFIWNNLNLKMIHRPIKLEMKEQGELEKLWKSTKHWPHWVWWWDISFENNWTTWTTWRLLWTQGEWNWSRESWRSFAKQPNIDHIGLADISFENNLNNLKITLNRNQIGAEEENLGKLWESIELWPIRFGGEIFLWLLEDDLETFTVQSNWRWRSPTDWRSVAVTEGLNIYIDCMGPLCMSSIVSGNLSQSSWFSHHYLMNGIELSDRRRRYYYSLACTTRYLTNGM